ncbi:hypothetical protein M634_15025 [Vibrio parahaemolyticus O1:Kuk str. FDA_R31]|nr:hypothetical protein M634_15025 [Vibrio parahaemolyticus O1:Kuk str. FDA_R31]KIT45125.1 hypothetical protein H331_20755 [Vibrio parahaemolyticus 3644]KIT53226.1 hypothetical protein H336_03980 [Vibrio parahaemolyticus EN9701072]KIT53477.1 hypothetical protein H334_03840 [Vibrio parahaemolyticus 901128]PIS71219.1 hypothetical protein H271_09390 [Vibrio parahaemolyticus 1911C]
MSTADTAIVKYNQLKLRNKKTEPKRTPFNENASYSITS